MDESHDHHLSNQPCPIHIFGTFLKNASPLSCSLFIIWDWVWQPVLCACERPVCLWQPCLLSCLCACASPARHVRHRLNRSQPAGSSLSGRVAGGMSRRTCMAKGQRPQGEADGKADRGEARNRWRGGSRGHGGITDACHDLAQELGLHALPVAPGGLLQHHLSPPSSPTSLSRQVHHPATSHGVCTYL